MKEDKDLTIAELEIGPHFVTLYGMPFSNLLKFGEDLYFEFAKTYKNLVEFQQKYFAHEPDDPNVYHPFGSPKMFRENFRHFHIRFPEGPTEEDIDYVKAKIKERTCKDSFKVSLLSDNKEEKHRHLSYPEVPSKENYLQWIDEMRTGKWRK